MAGPQDVDAGVTLRLAKNVSGAAMPRHALFRVTGVDADGFIEVNKPDTNDKADGVGWREPIADGEYGQVTFDSPVVVVYDSASGTPAAGDEWGPAAGSWLLTSGKKGWKVYGGATPQDTPADTGLVLAGRLGGPDNPWCLGPFLYGYTCTDNGDGTFTANLDWRYAHWDGVTLTINMTPC